MDDAKFEALQDKLDKAQTLRKKMNRIVASLTAIMGNQELEVTAQVISSGCFLEGIKLNNNTIRALQTQLESDLQKLEKEYGEL